MIKTKFLNFDDIFPQTKGISHDDKKDKIELAKNVAKALEKEREKVAKENRNNSTHGFFYQATG